MTTTSLQDLQAIAKEQVAKYPQYNGHELKYVLGAIKKRIKTKMGIAFEPNEVVLVQPIDKARDQFIFAWSTRNRIATSIPVKDVVYI